MWGGGGVVSGCSFTRTCFRDDIKVGCKGVFVTRTCFRDDYMKSGV